MTSMANVVAGVRTVTSEAKASVNLERPVQTGLSVFKASQFRRNLANLRPPKCRRSKEAEKVSSFPLINLLSRIVLPQLRPSLVETHHLRQ